MAGKMRWLTMECRLREILRDARNTDAKVILYRMDACIGAYTKRGMELPTPDNPILQRAITREWDDEESR